MRIGVNARILTSLTMEGVHRYIYETVREMATNHPEDDFILFFDRKVKVDFGFPSNVTPVFVPAHARKPILWTWWFEWMLPIYLKKYKIDVFYSGDGYLSLKSEIPSVMAIHDLAYLHFPDYMKKDSLKYYEKNVLRYLERANHIITVSEFVKNDIIDHFCIPENKISVAGNAVDTLPHYTETDLRKTLPFDPSDNPYFLYVGSIHPRKNINNLIHAFNQFQKKYPQFKLVLAGRMAWKTDHIEALIKTSPAVFYTGMVSENVKYKLISEAFAFAYISVFEGFGIPLLEAMKTGTPVITSSVTSMPEVAHGAALLANPTDIDDISQKMENLVNNPDVREKLIEAGYKRVKDFSWKTSSEIIYSCLKKVI